jgi:polar amino acid transport system substrate-binding protein
MRAWLSRALILVFAVGALAGCTQESGNSLAQITEKGEISFAMSGGYPPFNYYDKDNNLVGFDVDIAAEVARRLGVELKPVTTAWDGILEGLLAARYDGILGSMGITPERLERVDFSDPYYLDGSQLVVRADSSITGPDALQNASVALVTGTTFEADAAAMTGVADVKLFEDDNQTLSELRNGRVDGVITGYFVAVNAVNEFPNDFKLAGDRIRAEEIAVAIRKENADLVSAINEALSAMRQDGTYAQISEKWFGRDISQ